MKQTNRKKEDNKASVKALRCTRENAKRKKKGDESLRIDGKTGR
jgi:hypothetical protein